MIGVNVNGYDARQLKEAMTAEQSTTLAKLRRELKTFDALKPGPMPLAMGLVDAGAKTDKTFVLVHGATRKSCLIKWKTFRRIGVQF